VRAKAGFFIACFSALFLAAIAGRELRAQASAPPTQPAGGSFQDSSNELSVAVGKTVLVDCVRTVTRVAIGLGEVAEASAISPNEIMVNGRAPGETSLIIWDDRGGRQFFNITVRASTSALDNNIDAVRRELITELPGQKVKVTPENGNIYLRGTVKDLSSVARAIQIAATAGKVVDLLNVEVPKSDPQILLKVRFEAVERNRWASIFSISAWATPLAASPQGSSPPPPWVEPLRRPRGRLLQVRAAFPQAELRQFFPMSSILWPSSRV
jgi:pilus assembly protein CpaC